VSGNASGYVAPDEPDRPETAPGRGDPVITDVRDLPGDDLVARAFAILAEEQDRWHPGRPAPIQRESSS
jgi:hypothetical protein